MLVRGPSGHRVTVWAGSRRRVSIMKSTACWGCSAMVGSASCGPFRPVCPCTYSAVTSLRFIGRSQPAKTRVWGFPASSQMIRLFFSVKCKGTLPATAVTPRTSSSGLASARRMAKASSCPGSVSMMILRVMGGSPWSQAALLAHPHRQGQRKRGPRRPPFPGLMALADQPSKFTVSMIFTAAGRCAAISARVLSSAVNSPQDCTSADRSTPSFTGYS